jgi:hypothetical protein
MATAGPLLRWVRALLLAAVGLSTGVMVHLSADGLLPGPWAMVLLWGLSTVGAAPFLGTPASTRRVVTLLVVWQTLIHGALTVLSGHRGDLPGARQAAGEHAHGVVSSRLHHVIEDMSGPHAAMALGHVVAAALVGLWLAAGERALWRLLTLAAGPVRLVLAAVRSVAAGVGWSGAVPRITASQVASGAALLALWFLVRAVPRRGPPVVV